MLNFFSRLVRTPLSSKEEEPPADRRRKTQEPSCLPQIYPERKRMQHSLGTNILGFPSSEGMLQEECTIIELDYLGLRNLSSSSEDEDIPRLDDPVEEDIYGRKLIMLGAIHWPGMRHWIETWIGEENRTEAEQVQLEVGWPEDGCVVWIRRWDSWDRYNTAQREEPQERFARLEKARKKYG